jgi:hypothetical protein
MPAGTPSALPLIKSVPGDVSPESMLAEIADAKAWQAAPKRQSRRQTALAAPMKIKDHWPGPAGHGDCTRDGHHANLLPGSAAPSSRLAAIAAPHIHKLVSCVRRPMSRPRASIADHVVITGTPAQHSGLITRW